MKNNVTELVFILDMSGSMEGLTADTIGGFNSMIEKQREQEGEVLVSTVVFNSDSRVIHDRVPLGNVERLTREDYSPQGCTALLDAVGGAIHHIGNIHKYARPEDVPDKTLFVITTDGMENSSRFYDIKKVKSMIERQQKKYNWEFLFLGANIDAAETAGSMGIDRRNAVDYCADSKGSGKLFRAVGCAVAYARSGGECSQNEEWREELDEDFAERGGKR